MKTELMPCPCCGNNAKPRQFRSGILKSRTVHYVECVVCRLRTPVELDIETAAETWNRRAKTCYSAPKLMPMGALTYAIACSHCKNRESSLCEDCVCEVTSGFELDPDTLPAAPGIWLAGKDDLGIDRGWKCSVCGGYVYEMTHEPYLFCPHCGAKINQFEYVTTHTKNNKEERIMEKFYLGSKLVQAWPAVRITTRDGKFEYAEIGDVVDPNAQKVEEGYRVQYDDGYRSWSPKAVFERSYRTTTGLSFGLAIEAMKMGRAVAREGWNGKEMFLYYVPANEYAVTTEIARSYFGDTVPYGAYIAMKTMQGNVVPWLASQTDMLTDDWYIVE